MPIFVVVSYDIPDDYRRNRLAELLLDYGNRVQKSVFECHLDKPGLRQLQSEVTSLINPQEDDVRFYRLCDRCLEHAEAWGKGEISEEPAYYLV